MSEIRIFQNQKFSILQIAILRAYCELTIQEKTKLPNPSIETNPESSRPEYGLREIAQILIHYFWPIFQGPFISQSEAETEQNIKLKFRKQLTNIISTYDGNWEESYSRFKNELNLTLHNRLIDQKKGLQIKSCLHSIEQAILKGPVSSFHKSIEQNFITFLPKTKTLHLIGEYKDIILHESNDFLLALKNHWLELTLKWNPNIINSIDELKEKIYWDSFKSEINI
ncbi:MAG: hypothetical protein MH321_04670 [Leptospiraceae bacterium]|nr:hypothetical protein [Leptospiraceae bacterium]